MSFNELKITWAVNTWFYDTFAFIYALPLRSRGVSQRRRESTTSSRALRYISSMRYVDSCAMAAGREGEVYLNFVSTLSTSFWQSRERVRETFRFLPKVYEKRWKFIGYVAARNSLWVESSSIGFSNLNAWDVIFCLLIFFIFATSKQVVTDADIFPPISCASLLTHLRLKLPAHIFHSFHWIIESFYFFH